MSENRITHRVELVNPMNCYDKNGKELKIGTMVFSRTKHIGEIIRYDIVDTEKYIVVKYFDGILNEYTRLNEYSFLPSSITVVTPEEAMLYKLEFYAQEKEKEMK
jgi:hypothetical protein